MTEQVDPLEPYRRMANSIRFVPPLPLKSPSHYTLTDSTPILGSAPNPPISAPIASPATSRLIPSTHSEQPLPPLHSSDRTAELVRAAVSRPTSLPPIYILQENIGDRISRLTPVPPPKPEPILFRPKIPQPDPHWHLTPALIQPTDNSILPTVAELVSHESHGHEPIDIEPVVVEPVAVEPIDIEPVAVEPVVIEPVVVEPIDIKPVAVETIELESVAVESDLQPSDPTDAITTWLGSMVNYMEGITHKLVDEPPQDTQPEADLPDTNGISCPECRSSDIRKNGHRGSKQKYRCKTCGRQFTDSPIAQPSQLEEIPFTKSSKVAMKKKARGFGTKAK
ncbi:MAG: IS1 family transposase [Cyanobacteria bacterium RU_5_0]|nr:IS1 family transposase [Cyanobacteria bacterium RU_5_0]